MDACAAAAFGASRARQRQGSEVCSHGGVLRGLGGAACGLERRLESPSGSGSSDSGRSGDEEGDSGSDLEPHLDELSNCLEGGPATPNFADDGIANRASSSQTPWSHWSASLSSTSRPSQRLLETLELVPIVPQTPLKGLVAALGAYTGAAAWSFSSAHRRESGVSVGFNMAVVYFATLVLHVLAELVPRFQKVVLPQHPVYGPMWSIAFALLASHFQCFFLDNAQECARVSLDSPWLWQQGSYIRSVGWMALALLQLIRVPTVPWRSLTGRQQLALAAMAAQVAALCLSLLHFWAAGCFRHGMSVLGPAVWSQMTVAAAMIQNRVFLETGDATGCRALLLFVFVLNLFATFRGPGVRTETPWLVYGSMATVATSVGLMHFATNEPEEICSTSPMYYSPYSGPTSGSDVGSPRLSMTSWTRTWRGRMAILLANSVLSMIVYGPLWESHKASMSTSTEEAAIMFVHFKTVNDCRIATLGLSSLAFVMTGVSLLVDFCREKGIMSWAMPYIPMDRHFRLLTLLKVTMIIVKVDVLLAFQMSSSEQSLSRLLLQTLSIATTAGTACWQVVAVHFGALASKSFRASFRAPRILGASSLLCLLTFQINLAFILIGNVFVVEWNITERSFRLAAITSKRSAPALVVFNEIVLLLSSKVSKPKVFSAVRSPQGVKAIVSAAYFQSPICLSLMFFAWTSYCDHLHLSLDQVFYDKVVIFNYAVHVMIPCLAWVTYLSL